jgi:hypothetical protein
MVKSLKQMLYHYEVETSIFLYIKRKRLLSCKYNLVIFNEYLSLVICFIPQL